MDVEVDAFAEDVQSHTSDLLDTAHFTRRRELERIKALVQARGCGVQSAVSLAPDCDLGCRLCRRWCCRRLLWSRWPSCCCRAARCTHTRRLCVAPTELHWPGRVREVSRAGVDHPPAGRPTRAALRPGAAALRAARAARPSSSGGRGSARDLGGALGASPASLPRAFSHATLPNRSCACCWCS